jgi:hypothetical protein
MTDMNHNDNNDTIGNWIRQAAPGGSWLRTRAASSRATSSSPIRATPATAALS